MALSGTAIFCGQFGSPLLLGPIGDATSVSGAFLAAAVLAGVVLVALLGVELESADPRRRAVAAR